MLGKYDNLTIIILIAGMGITIPSVIVLLKVVISLSKENEKLKNKDRKVEKELSILRATITRIFAVIDSNAGSIVLLRQQMNQVHGWLGEVLSISNLIRGEGEDRIGSKEVIEELRDRVRWENEREKRQIDENEYYKGD